MVGLAAVAPPALGCGVLLEGLVFAVLRFRGWRDAKIPGAVFLYLGSMMNTLVIVSLPHYL